MRYWAEKGTPVQKLNMGFATYGRTFRLSTQSSQAGAPASSPAAAGTFTREPGIWSYYEVNRNPHSHINMFILSQFLCLSSRSMLICQVTTQNMFFYLFSDLHLSSRGQCPLDWGPESPICHQTKRVGWIWQ